jgi:plastocyanin
MGRRAFAVIVFLLIALSFGAPAALAGGGCHGGQFTDVRGVKVNLSEMCFTPTVIRIQPGQRVTWTNQDNTAHTVTGAAFQWGSTDQLAYRQTISFRFASSGVYPYFCMLHPGMVGAVVVGDGTSSDTTSQDIVPIVNTPVPTPPAGQPAQTPVAAHGVSRVWRLAAIAGFGLFLAAAVVLAAQFGLSRSRRATARA